MITVSFVKQAMLCRAFSIIYPENYPHKSGAIFHIDLYVFNIPTKISNGTNKLNHVKRPAVFQNEPFWILYGRMNHLCCDWNKRMLTIIRNIFCNPRAWWLPLVDKRFVVNKLVAFSIIFFWTWCHKQWCQAQQCCSNRRRWFFVWGSFKLIIIKINETQLSW